MTCELNDLGEGIGEQGEIRFRLSTPSFQVLINGGNIYIYSIPPPLHCHMPDGRQAQRAIALLLFSTLTHTHIYSSSSTASATQDGSSPSDAVSRKRRDNPYHVGARFSGVGESGGDWRFGGGSW